MGENVEFPSNGSTGHGYLARPESGSGPGVVVIQEWWGLVDHIRDVCDRFAAEGFVALAPDLYHGESTTEPDEAGKKMMGLNIGKAAADLTGAVDHLASQSTGGGVGVVGFCMGGGLALYLGSIAADRVRAVAPFYGLIPWDAAQPDWSALAPVAVQGHYAGRDGFFDAEAVAGLRSDLEANGVDHEIFVYDADHAFFNDTRPEVFDPEASAQAWSRTVAFLRTHLAG